MTGWHTEVFARTKQVKPLGSYLRPPPKPNPERAARDVMHLFDRILAEQGEGADHGDR